MTVEQLQRALEGLPPNMEVLGMQSIAGRMRQLFELQRPMPDPLHVYDGYAIIGLRFKEVIEAGSKDGKE